jgi:predicted membrane metal-binding protein
MKHIENLIDNFDNGSGLRRFAAITAYISLITVMGVILFSLILLLAWILVWTVGVFGWISIAAPISLFIGWAFWYGGKHEPR